MKKRIKVNQWDNINGYIGNKKVIEFGTDRILAELWVNDDPEYQVLIDESKRHIMGGIRL